MVEVFEDFHYVRQLREGSEQAYVFTATVDGLDITGGDFLTLDENGKITECMVMTRPLRASQGTGRPDGRALRGHQGHRGSLLRGRGSAIVR